MNVEKKELFSPPTNLVRKKDNIPVQLPILAINNCNCKIKQEEFTKFLGVLLNENVT